MSDATDVLQAVDQLRRDLSGYHGQLKAHNDLQRHCDHQRERIAELEAIHARDKAENAKLRELARNLRRVIPADVVGVVIGANTDHPTYYKFDEAFRELGIEVDE